METSYLFLTCDLWKLNSKKDDNEQMFIIFAIEKKKIICPEDRN
jgi:hypothetical protein